MPSKKRKSGVTDVGSLDMVSADQSTDGEQLEANSPEINNNDKEKVDDVPKLNLSHLSKATHEGRQSSKHD